MAMIHEAIAAMMKETEPIRKGRTNDQQNYKFRGIDDIYNAIHPMFAEHGVFTVPKVLEERSEERQSRTGGALIYRILTIHYDFFAADGSSIEAVVMGEGMDSGDKASNKAMSVAHKYAIMQLLCIPTGDGIDPETDNPDPLPKAGTPQGKAKEPMKVCPECGKQTVIKGKAEYGGGWLCWKKKGGCGAKFDEYDQHFTGESGGAAQRVEKEVEPHRKAVIDHLLALFNAGRFDKDTAASVKAQANKAAIVPDTKAAIAELKKILASLPAVPDVDPDIDKAANKGFAEEAGDKLAKLAGDKPQTASKQVRVGGGGDAMGEIAADAADNLGEQGERF